MKVKLILFSIACLSYFLVPVLGVSLAAPAGKGVLIRKLTVGRHPVTILTKPPQPVHSVTIADKLSKVWNGICSIINKKIKAVGSLFHKPPNVVISTTQKPPVVIQVEIPHRRYPVRAPSIVYNY